MSFQSLVRSIFSDFSYKFIALLVAASIWISFAGTHKQVLVMDVKVNYSLGEGMSFRKNPPYSVQIKLSGPRVSMNKLNNLRQTLLFNLQQAQEGINEVRVTDDKFSLPLGVKLIEVEPERIYLDILKTKTEVKEE